MATNPYGMFSTITPQEAQNAYLNQFSVSPEALGQMNPYQQMVALAASGGAAAGAGLGRLFGGKTSMEVQQAKMQDIMNRASSMTDDPLQRLSIASKMASDAGLQDLSMALQDRLSTQTDIQSKIEERQSSIASRKAAADKAGREEMYRQQLGTYLESILPGLPSGGGYALAGDSKAVAELLKTPKEEKPTVVTADGKVQLINSKGDVIKVLGEAKTSSIDALTSQLKQAQLESLNAKTAAEKATAQEKLDKLATEKRQSISALANAETDIEDTLATAAKLMNIAPSSFAGAVKLSFGSSIPWSDSKAVMNLVKSVQSDKAMSTLAEAKRQSRTGATGFGALNEKELDLIMSKGRALDPTDKNFKENLTFVIDGFTRTLASLRKERLALQGKPSTEPSTYTAAQEAAIQKVMQSNPGASREQVIKSMLDNGYLPKQ